MIFENIDRASRFVAGPFAGFVSLSEFAAIHHVDDSAIRHAIKSGRFTIGTDCMKFGKQWIMSKNAFCAYSGNLFVFSDVTYRAQEFIKRENARIAQTVSEITR